MKEIIVIEKELLEKIIKASPIQWFDNKEKTDKIVIFGKEYETMQVPETWEELKFLCTQQYNQSKDLKFGKREYNGTTKESMILDVFMVLCENGDVFVGEESDFLISNRTPQQMWNIIKNLIGEE